MKNYYAVAIGRKPGIYKKWSEKNGAEEQVKGFSKALFKGFEYENEAITWFKNNTPTNDFK